MSVIINVSAGVTTNSGAVYNGIQGATAVASTSGTSIDFNSIPSWVKRITIMLNGVSTSGTSLLIFRLGTTSGIETSGYVGQAWGALATGGNGGTMQTTGFDTIATAAAGVHSGHVVLTNVSGNTWIESHTIAASSATYIVLLGAGSKTTASTLDRVRITTVNGTDTFDAGSINILYE